MTPIFNRHLFTSQIRHLTPENIIFYGSAFQRVAIGGYSGGTRSYLGIIFLSPFAKLQKTDLVISVHPSVLMQQLGSHWQHFNEI
jgi:hypothetical protein